MKLLQAKNPEKYQKQFARYVKAGKGPDDIEKNVDSCACQYSKRSITQESREKTSPKES